MTIRHHLAYRITLVALLAAGACRSVGGPSPTRQAATPASDDAGRLPTGARLDPAGQSFDLGSMPLALAVAPGGDRLVVLLNGWREQGLQVVDRATGRVLQTLPQPAAFLGIAFAPDGRTLYASGGNQDVVYRYAWRDGAATLADSLVLAPTPAAGGSPHYPAGLALSPDGRRLFVAENLADSLAVVDLASGRVVQRLATERYPYGVAVAPDGAVYVSAWGGSTVSVFEPSAPDSAPLVDRGRVRVGRHPSALLLSADGGRLFIASGSTDRVAVMDTRARRVVAELLDPPGTGPTPGPGEGSTPNALALSVDGTRLFVAEADNNAVAVFDLSPATSGVSSARGDDRLAGRVPVGWYPTALTALGDTLLVVNGKGRGTAPNPDGSNPLKPPARNPRAYTLGQTSGTLTVVGAARLDRQALAPLSERVARANNWTGTGDLGLGTRGRAAQSPVPSPQSLGYPPFEHVVYVIKENRTYDQILGDIPEADGDTALVFFPRAVTPNHHALAERFGIYDRFFVNAEVSADGHNWSTAAYATDYVEKTVPSQYSGRRPDYDYEGTNRGRIPDDDVAEPANGYLWDLAQRAGITLRNYGEFVIPDGAEREGEVPSGYRGTKPFLAANTNPRFPAYDLSIRDQVRADVWIAELHEYVRRGVMPALEIMRLPNDHTSGARPGTPTPRAHMADNDLALGRIIEALSNTPFWRSTVVFVLEDDAQNGPDHVDSHRSPLFVVSPYNRPGVIHRFANTTDVIATIAEILGLGSLSQFDYYGRPLREVWADAPDLTPYVAQTPAASLDERNPERGPGAAESARLDLRFEDISDDDLFNRILWKAIKGEHVPYPGATRMSALEARRSR